MAIIETPAAVREGGAWRVTDTRVGDPGEHEVRVRLAASGICPIDAHAPDGGTASGAAGGHEGAGVVESVGRGVGRVAEGDRVVLSRVPACGACRPCSTGHQNLCVRTADSAPHGTFARDVLVSEWAVVRLPDELPFALAPQLGCGVPTGWGTAVYAAGVSAGDTVVVFGADGIGRDAVQGARHAGADAVIVIDPVETRRAGAAEYGATAAVATAEEAAELVVRATRGQGAEHVLLSPDATGPDTLAAAVPLAGKGAALTVAGDGPYSRGFRVDVGMLVLWQRRIRGAQLGDCNPLFDIPRLARLHAAGRLRLDDGGSRTYALDDLDRAFDDLASARSIRATILHDD